MLGTSVLSSGTFQIVARHHADILLAIRRVVIVLTECSSPAARATSPRQSEEQFQRELNFALAVGRRGRDPTVGRTRDANIGSAR
jgi:hypothetical protein